MGVEVTKNFEKQFGKLDAQTQQAVTEALEKLAENPQSVRFETKKGNAREIYTMRVDGSNRVAFVKNADGNFVPAFVGNHREYDKFLDQKANKLTATSILGDDNSRVRTMDLEVPESLRKPGILDRTNFSIGGIKLHGITGTIITSGIILGLGGTPRDAVAATTPGHVGLELAEGDIQGATEALVVDGAGDVGCLVVGAAGLKYGAAGGATLGAGAAGVGAGPGALIGGGLGAVGGCIVGGIAASETAQAVWNWFFEDEEDPMADPAETLADLKAMEIEHVPDEVTPDMPDELKELVQYKQNVAEALDTLNQSASALAEDPKNESLREAFAEASSDFSQAAEAYTYSYSTIEEPEAIQAYMQNIAEQQVKAQQEAAVATDPSLYDQNRNTNTIAAAAP